MNNLLTHYPVNWIDGMKLSSRTHSYYTRQELQARTSRGYHYFNLELDEKDKKKLKALVYYFFVFSL